MKPHKKTTQHKSHEFNAAWGLVTLHNATTREVLDYLNIPSLPFPVPDKLTYKDFLLIKEYVLGKREYSIDQLYNTKDFVIESQTYAHIKESRARIAELCANILPPRNPKQVCKLLYFQDEAAMLSLYMILQQNIQGILLRAKTGTGKTFYGGQLIRWLRDLNFHKDCLSPYPYLWLTKASIVDQTTEDLENEFGLRVPQDVLVMNYEALATSKGRQSFIDVSVKVEHGEEIVKYSWNEMIKPKFVLRDECHVEKNPKSTTFKLGYAFNDHIGDSVQVRMSATPASRLVSFTNFAVSTRLTYSFGLGISAPLGNNSVKSFLEEIAQPDKPEEFSRPAMKRFLKRTGKYIVGFKNVRQKFHATNTIEYMSFANKDEETRYMLCIEKYAERIKKIRGEADPSSAAIQELVALMIMQQETEIIRCEKKLPLYMYNAVSNGMAAVAACKYKTSIAKAIMALHTEYGVSREEISLIWGGDSSMSGTGPRYDKEYIQRLVRGEEGEVTKGLLQKILRQLQLDAAGLTDIPPELDLGIQDRKTRWREIKRFQGGPSEPQRTKYCFFTFGVGGAGLSLHHRYNHTLPRRFFASPVWNEMEWIQAFGRCDRITMLSDVVQSALLYKNTIEPQVYGRCMQKGQCLEEVVSHSDLVDDKLLDQILELSGNMIDEEDDERGGELFDEIEDNNEESE